MNSTVVVITGPPGVGKTSVLERLTTHLEILGVEFGALESEQLGWGSPWLPDEAVLRQMEAVLRIQRDAGRRLFLIAATTETDEQLRAFIHATSAEKVTVVLLTASPNVVGDRVREREPDDWPGKAHLVGHARELAVSMPGLTGIHLTLSTDYRQADDVARELLAMLQAANALETPAPGFSR